jgi:hypothetical protein
MSKMSLSRALLFSLILALVALQAAAQTVRNPSFEATPSGPAYWTEYGDGATSDPNNSATVYTPPTFGLDAAFDGRRVYGAVRDGARMSGGIYQQILGAVPGVRYMARVRIFTARTGNGEMRCSIGIDPFGGTDPSSSQVAWLESIHSDARWSPIEITATAMSTAVTIYLSYHQSGSTGFAINYFELIANPPPPQPCPDPDQRIELTLADRRIDRYEPVETHYAVPPGYVITGLGARLGRERLENAGSAEPIAAGRYARRPGGGAVRVRP